MNRPVLIPNLPPIHQELMQQVKLSEGEGKNKRYHMHPIWHDFFSQLTTALQKTISQEGVGVPAQTTSNIAALNVPSKNFTLIADNETNELKVLLNGVVNVINTTPA